MYASASTVPSLSRSLAAARLDLGRRSRSGRRCVARAPFKPDLARLSPTPELLVYRPDKGSYKDYPAQEHFYPLTEGRRCQPSRWSTLRWGSRAQNCSQMGSMMYGWSADTEYVTSRFGSFDNSPDDRASVSALPVEALPIEAASKLTTGDAKEGQHGVRVHHWSSSSNVTPISRWVLGAEEARAKYEETIEQLEAQSLVLAGVVLIETSRVTDVRL